MYLKSDILFYVFHVVCVLHYDIVEVHRELAKVSMGAKDMAIKNKNVWKVIK